MFVKIIGVNSLKDVKNHIPHKVLQSKKGNHQLHKRVNKNAKN